MRCSRAARVSWLAVALLGAAEVRAQYPECPSTCTSGSGVCICDATPTGPVPTNANAFQIPAGVPYLIKAWGGGGNNISDYLIRCQGGWGVPGGGAGFAWGLFPSDAARTVFFTVADVALSDPRGGGASNARLGAQGATPAIIAAGGGGGACYATTAASVGYGGAGGGVTGLAGQGALTLAGGAGGAECTTVAVGNPTSGAFGNNSHLSSGGGGAGCQAGASGPVSVPPARAAAGGGGGASYASPILPVASGTIAGAGYHPGNEIDPDRGDRGRGALAWQVAPNAGTRPVGGRIVARWPANPGGTIADVSVANTDGVTSVSSGQQSYYAVTVTNSAAVAVDVFVENSLVGLDACTWTCSPGAGSSCTTGPMTGGLTDIARLAAGGSASYGLACTVTAPAASTASSTVTVSVPGATDPDPDDNTATDVDTVGPGAPFVKGDLNRDGQTDLVLRRATGDAENWKHEAWLMNGTDRVGTPVAVWPRPTANWELSGVDDLTGDGWNDFVFWDSTTGLVEIWPLRLATRLGEPLPLQNAVARPSPWKLSAVADFDHDGAPDIVWRNFSTQKIEIWTLAGTTVTGTLVPFPDQAVDANWEIVAALDYGNDVAGAGGHKDGNTDLLWYNSTSGKIVIWFMDGSVVRTTGHFTVPAQAGDANWKVLAGGDFGIGADGADAAPPVAGSNDIVWRNATSGRFVVWHLDFAGNRTHGLFTSPMEPAPAPTSWTIVGPR